MIRFRWGKFHRKMNIKFLRGKTVTVLRGLSLDEFGAMNRVRGSKLLVELIHFQGFHLLLGHSQPLVVIEIPLAKAERFWCDFNILVV
jgi:hypothetical protein